MYPRIFIILILLAFSRPQMKGRTVFGQLVPYDKMWRTEANENTTISFSHRVEIGEKEEARKNFELSLDMAISSENTDLVEANKQELTVHLLKTNER